MMVLRNILFLLSLIIAGAACKKEENTDPKSMFVGSWNIDSATIIEYVSDTVNFTYTRKIDYAYIEFFADKVYNSHDSENSIFFFSQEGLEGAANQVEGGIWMPQNNYTTIRLDNQVPEFNGRTPSVLDINKLTQNELDFTYDLNPWIFNKDTIGFDTTGQRFVLPVAIEDGKTGRVFKDTTYETGYEWGAKIGYDVGYYLGQRANFSLPQPKGAPKPVITAKMYYALVFYTNYNTYFVNTNPRYARLYQGFRAGFNDPKRGQPKGNTDGSKVDLYKVSKKYKFIYKASKRS